MASEAASRRIRIGMVGGGEGAFIGAVHRIAARLDEEYELVAGALSSEPERARRSAAAIGLAPDRSYGSFEEMAKLEAARPDGIEAVVIVTPNHMHYPVARAFLEAGIHVICDKPMTSTLADARALAALVHKSGKLFVLTHNYTAYPMVRQARRMVAAGELGKIRVVQVEYPQAWLATKLEDSGQKQAAWRTDPERSGAGGCVGDIGTHAFNLACFVTGLDVESLSADVSTFVEGRAVDDNIHVLLRFSGGAKGMLWASQVAAGHENDLRLRVYGESGALSFAQEEPNRLWVSKLDEPKRLVTRHGAGFDPEASRLTRVPAGHPEGYLEGFANLYVEAALAIRAARKGGSPAVETALPSAEDGVKGMEFIEAVLRSSSQNGAWVNLQG
jgi:predicted dehydrogenase